MYIDRAGKVRYLEHVMSEMLHYFNVNFKRVRIKEAHEF